MSDPLSVAGSAVGIVSLGIQVTQSLWNYYSRFKDQYTNISSILAGLESLSSILQRMEKRGKYRQFRASEAALVAQIESIVAECKANIDSLAQEASKFQKTRSYGFSHILGAIRHGSFYRKLFRRVAYPFREATLAKLRVDIDSLLERLSLTMDLLQQETLDLVEAGVTDIRTTQVASEIREWLKAPDAAVEFHQASGKRHATSGSWLIEGDQFDSWFKRPSSFLWLHGIAGSGKSVLCSTAIHHTQASATTQQDVGVAYFFFTFSDVKKQDKRAMIRALIIQLADQLPGTDNALHQLHRKSKMSSPSENDFIECLRQLVRSFHHTYIFLDGIDESPRSGHRSHVLDMIRNMRSWPSNPDSSMGQLHLLVTSRDEPDIRRAFSPDTECIISMNLSGISKDITSFISQELESNPHRAHLKPFQARIQQELTQRANGVFRWAECQLEEITASAFSPHLLEQVLQKLPKTLNDTYDRMIENIPGECKSYARQMLTVLCISMVPLTVDQLIDAVAVDLEQTPPQFDPSRRLQDFDAVQRICPSFTDSYKGLRGDTYVRIAHFSVQQYLESGRTRQKQDAHQIVASKQDAHALMASVCLAVFMDPNMPPFDYFGNLENISLLHPLAQYASLAWTVHFKKSGQHHRVAKQVLQFFKDTDQAHRIWASVYQSSIILHAGQFSQTRNPLFLASYFGLLDTVKGLCKDYTLWRSSSLPSSTLAGLISAGYEDDLTPLSRTSGGWWSSWKTVVPYGIAKVPIVLDRFRVLFMNMWFVSFYQSSLQEKSTSPGGDPTWWHRVVHLNTTLLAGVASGSIELVQTLFKFGGDFGKGSNHGRMALFLAVLSGNEAMVRALLEHDNSLKLPDDTQDAILEKAENYGWQDVVGVLKKMKRGALGPPELAEGSARVNVATHG